MDYQLDKLVRAATEAAEQATKTLRAAEIYLKKSNAT